MKGAFQQKCQKIIYLRSLESSESNKNTKKNYNSEPTFFLLFWHYFWCIFIWKNCYVKLCLNICEPVSFRIRLSNFLQNGLQGNNFYNNNHAYRKHQLSRRVQIVAPILWNPVFFTLVWTCAHFLAIYLHLLALFDFFRHFIFKKKILRHMSHVACHMLYITCHMSPVTNANLSLLTLPFSTEDWFQIKKKIYIHGQKTLLKPL